jgi:hypothetical protein
MPGWLGVGDQGHIKIALFVDQSRMVVIGGRVIRRVSDSGCGRVGLDVWVRAAMVVVKGPKTPQWWYLKATGEAHALRALRPAIH